MYWNIIGNMIMWGFTKSIGHIQSCSLIKGNINKFYTLAGHFPIPLILWLPMPLMVHGERAEGGTGPLFSGTTTAPITLGPSGLISHFGAYWSLLNADNKDWFFFCFMFGIWIKWASFGSKKQSQYDKYKTQEKSQTIHYFYKLQLSKAISMWSRLWTVE